MKHKKSQITSGSPIHIKLEYPEAVKSKRDILSTEMNLLRILKVIKKYHALRMNELDMKIKLHKKESELKSSLKKMQVTFPKIKLPDILKKEDYFEVEEKEEHSEKKDIRSKVKQVKEKEHQNDIEYQLREIQEKLRALQ